MSIPVFVISDLHIGSGGIRDSFVQFNRDSCFSKFLDYVEKEGGELIILGDFIDLWRFSLKKIIRERIDLLDRLAAMKVSCIPGNHDHALTGFIDTSDVPHPFFRKILKPCIRTFGGKKISFFHGHELDIYNRNLTPRIGRILGVSSSWVEYIRGYPVFSSENIEEALLNIEEKFFVFYFNVMSQLNKFLNISEIFESIQVLPRQKRIEKQILKHEYKKIIEGNDISISAHTHRQCRFQDWYFNSGSWTDQTNDFLRILPDGKVDLFIWDTDTPRFNNIEIRSSSFYSKIKGNYVLAN